MPIGFRVQALVRRLGRRLSTLCRGGGGGRPLSLDIPPTTWRPQGGGGGWRPKTRGARPPPRQCRVGCPQTMGNVLLVGESGPVVPLLTRVAAAPWRRFARSRSQDHEVRGLLSTGACATFRPVVVPLRGPGQSPVRPFACCVGSLRSDGRCGRCSPPRFSSSGRTKSAKAGRRRGGGGGRGAERPGREAPGKLRGRGRRAPRSAGAGCNPPPPPLHTH